MSVVHCGFERSSASHDRARVPTKKMDFSTITSLIPKSSLSRLARPQTSNHRHDQDTLTSQKPRPPVVPWASPLSHRASPSLPARRLLFRFPLTLELPSICIPAAAEACSQPNPPQWTGPSTRPCWCVFKLLPPTVTCSNRLVAQLHVANLACH